RPARGRRDGARCPPARSGRHVRRAHRPDPRDPGLRGGVRVDRVRGGLLPSRDGVRRPGSARSRRGALRDMARVSHHPPRRPERRALDSPRLGRVGAMSKGRLEAFSDGVIAIIITIMVLEMKTPAGADVEALRAVIPVFSSYVLSFVFVGIYWNNHHHLLQAARQVNGRILWANLHFLFWLSLTPFVTRWMGESHFAPRPVALYGVVLLLTGGAYLVLTRTLIAHHGTDSA